MPIQAGGHSGIKVGQTIELRTVPSDFNTTQSFQARSLCNEISLGFDSNIPTLYIVSHMMKYIVTYAIHPVGLLLCTLFAVSLFWCGDAECMSGTSHDDCTSLVCSLLGNNTDSAQNSSSSSAKDCSCVCHVQSIAPGSINVYCFLTAQQNQCEIVLYTPLAFSRPVYHPPISA